MDSIHVFCGFGGFYGFHWLCAVSMVSMVFMVSMRCPWYLWCVAGFHAFHGLCSFDAVWVVCGFHVFHSLSPVSMVSMVCLLSLRFLWFSCFFHHFGGFHGFYLRLRVLRLLFFMVHRCRARRAVVLFVWVVHAFSWDIAVIIWKNAAHADVSNQKNMIHFEFNFKATYVLKVAKPSLLVLDWL